MVFMMLVVAGMFMAMGFGVIVPVVRVGGRLTKRWKLFYGIFHIISLCRGP